ncbi:hypothetical protein FRAHR75_60174 [Frankia sp. Hr75.2]|nr:hypothetical protein FRAHR75_60174 [Frankia sp. Hr75.2]
MVLLLALTPDALARPRHDTWADASRHARAPGTLTVRHRPVSSNTRSNTSGFGRRDVE